MHHDHRWSGRLGDGRRARTSAGVRPAGHLARRRGTLKIMSASGVTRGPALQPLMIMSALRRRTVGKPLAAALAGTFSARRGSFRILYEVADATRSVTVTAVPHRSQVYRRREASRARPDARFKARTTVHHTARDVGSVGAATRETGHKRQSAARFGVVCDRFPLDRLQLGPRPVAVRARGTSIALASLVRPQRPDASAIGSHSPGRARATSNRA